MTAPRQVRIFSRSTRVVGASLLVHLLLVVFLLHRSRIWVAPAHLPGTSHGTRMVLTYMPGHASLATPVTRVVKVTAPVSRRLMTPKVPRPVLHAAQASQAAAAAQPIGSGLDALGQGDVSIALMQFFPDPKPDLSRLPQGTRGDVVLEAVIDAGGRIAQLTVKQGVGYGVDESVLATVQQWTFHPAMRDGKPVASQQEFHFHYERG